MPLPSVPLRRLGFLTIGLFDGDDPGPGHESTLAVIELGEQLGFDSAWVRHRHLQYGISSPVAMLAAASQRTSRIELGTAVIPLGWENPLRLAEDLATVDLLSGGRLNPGVSVGPPMRWDDVKDALYPDTAEVEDFSYERVERLLRHGPRRGGQPDFSGTVGIEEFSDRVQPHSPGLADRLWYGGASLRSAQWAGEHGMNFLTSSVVKAEESEDFAEIQLSHIRRFRAHHPDGAAARVSQGLVVDPDGHGIEEQAAKYEQYAESRLARTATPQGPARMMFAPDLVGTSEQIAERLYAHAGLPRGRRGGLRAAVLLRARRLRPDPHRHRDPAPALGWQPAADRKAPPSLAGSSAGRRRGKRQDDDPLRSSHSSVEVCTTRASRWSQPGQRSTVPGPPTKARCSAKAAVASQPAQVTVTVVTSTAKTSAKGPAAALPSRATVARVRGGRSCQSPEGPKRSARMVRLV